MLLAAMVQAISGGLEKYPKAKCRDQSQYCASSTCRSVAEKRNASRRTIVMASNMIGSSAPESVERVTSAPFSGLGVNFAKSAIMVVRS